MYKFKKRMLSLNKIIFLTYKYRFFFKKKKKKEREREHYLKAMKLSPCFYFFSHKNENLLFFLLK